MFRRSDRQGTCLCCLFWDVDETGTRPFETGFRLSCLSEATEEKLCSFVEWSHGLRDGSALDKVIGRYSGKGCRMSFIQDSELPFWACHMSSIVINRTEFNRTSFSLLLDSARAFPSGLVGLRAFPFRACWSSGLPFPGLLVFGPSLSGLVGLRAFPFRACWSSGLPFPGLLVFGPSLSGLVTVMKKTGAEGNEDEEKH